MFTGLLVTAAPLAVTCTVPHVGKPTFDLPEDEMEFGVGIHGEPGRQRMNPEPLPAGITDKDVLRRFLCIHFPHKISAVMAGLMVTIRYESRPAAPKIQQLKFELKAAQPSRPGDRAFQASCNERFPLEL